jgi:hypothetical protein
MESQPEHHLTPPLSIADGASIFVLGEYVLVRIPGDILVNGYVDDEVTAGTALPHTSNGSSPQYFGFIRQVTFQEASGSSLLEVYPVISFTSRGGAVAGYNKLDDATKAMLLPLPSLSLSHPTPEAFGAPLNFGN